LTQAPSRPPDPWKLKKMLRGHNNLTLKAQRRKGAPKQMKEEFARALLGVFA